MDQKIPLFILPFNLSKSISHRLKGVSKKLLRFIPAISYDLKKTDLKIDADIYVGISLINSLFFFVFFFGLLFVLNYFVQHTVVKEALLTALKYSCLLFLLFIAVLLRYPTILAGKKAEEIDKNLVFALKDMLMQVNAGVSMYNALVNISKENYGLISKEFGRVAQQVTTGIPLEKGLEKMAVRSKSGFLRRTTWQLVNTMKAGASLKGALKTIINDLTLDQRAKIKDYAHELNLWSLIYMLFAVAIPTIGATMLVILSSFAGAGISKGMFIFFLIICFIIQIALIGLIKSRRPMVNI